MRVKFDSVDDYLSEVESDIARSCLERIREIIRDEIPDAEECISYGMPTFKLHGTLLSYASFKNHCSLFPGHTVADFEQELRAYKTSKGTIQFDPNDPLPEALLRAIVRAKANENLAVFKEKARQKKMR